MEKIKQILIESIERDIPKVRERFFDYSLLELDKIITFVGVRRSGKTSYLYLIMNYLLKRGISKKNLIYINFEDNRLYPLTGKELDSILENIQNFIEYNKKQKVYLFLDEIQNIPNWSKWVRRVYDDYKNFKIFITGSSSKLLSKEIVTELSGRTIGIEVFPLSFKEFLEFRDFEVSEIDLKTISYSKSRFDILNFFKEYFFNGGFPEILNMKSNKDLVLQEYFDSIFFKDIVVRYNIKSIKLFRDFLTLLINNISNRVSLTKLENTLKSIGHKVSKSTLSEYLYYSQEVYLVFTLSVFSYKIKDTLLYPKKVYIIDNGLANAISLKFNENKGALLENLVFVELRRRNKDIFYYITKNNLEVDFLVRENLKFTQLIQVASNLDEKNTKEREFKSLIKAMEELNLKEGLILTENEEFKEIVKDKKTGKEFTIHIRPVWKWLLED